MQRAALSLLVIAACSAPAGLSGASHDVTAELEVFLERAATLEVQVAALVVDVDSGEVLVSREARRLLRPASTMKVLTTAAACRRAPDGEVVTTLSATAPVGGEVVLEGAGDAFLTTEELRGLVRELREAGLESCERVRVVDPLAGAPRFGEGWMWDDEPAAFMPALSAAPIDSGCVTVTARGTAAGVEVRLGPVRGSLSLGAAAGGEDAGRFSVTRGRYREPDVLRVAGALPEGESTAVRMTVPDPAAYTAAVLVDALAREGVASDIPWSVARGPAPVAELRVALRRPVEELVWRTNKPSDNLGAELLLRLLPTLAGDAPGLRASSIEEGLEAVRSDVRALGLDPDTYRLADGSGVSHYTLVSAELLVRTLVDLHARGGRAFEVFERSLPVAGRDGTLERRMQGTAAEGRVRAKTGTISGVSNLAGYVATRSGRRLAFAVLVQSFVGPAGPWRGVQDGFCAALAEL